jgi:hypothetical protein
MTREQLLARVGDLEVECARRWSMYREAKVAAREGTDVDVAGARAAAEQALKAWRVARAQVFPGERCL